MDGSEDVQMAEAPSSRSSSLSPPPSSLPDTFEYHWEEEICIPAPENTCQSTNLEVPDTEISLESITLATPIPEEDEEDEIEMVQTRRQRKAEEEAEKARKYTAAQFAAVHALAKKAGVKKTTAKRPRPNGTKKTQEEEDGPADEAPEEAPAKTTTTKKSPPKKVPTKKSQNAEDEPMNEVPEEAPANKLKKPSPKKVVANPEVNDNSSPEKQVREPPPKKVVANPKVNGDDPSETKVPTTKKASPKKPTRATTRSTAGKKPETAEVPKTTSNTIKKKATKTNKWSPERVLTSYKSPLADLSGAQLRKLLCTPTAWDILTIQEKADIIALMPQTIATVRTSSGTRPDVSQLASNDHFNSDCGQYLDQLASGQHDRNWILDAMDAHDKNLSGGFDSLIQAQFKHDWEEEWPTESKDGEGDEDA